MGNSNSQSAAEKEEAKRDLDKLAAAQAHSLKMTVQYEHLLQEKESKRKKEEEEEEESKRKEKSSSEKGSSDSEKVET